MCPDIIPLAGGETAVVDLLRPHIANLKNRSKQCAKKLWTHLKAKLDSGSKVQDLWDRNVALILFSYLAAAIDIHYITGTGSSSDPGRWAIYIYKDFCRNMSAGLDLEFMDGCPTRASLEGLEAPLPRDIPLTANLIFATRPSKPAMVAMSSPSPTAFDPPIDDDSTPSILEIISAVQTTASKSDKRFTPRIQRKPRGGPKEYGPPSSSCQAASLLGLAPT